MNLVGGYRMVDFQNVNITADGEAVDIPGVYKVIEATKNKAIMFCNVLIDNIEQAPFFITYTIDDEAFVIVYNGKNLKITAEDKVSYTAA